MIREEYLTQGRKDAEKTGKRENEKGESVAVGFPNPLGGGTPPPTMAAVS